MHFVMYPVIACLCQKRMKHIIRKCSCLIGSLSSYTKAVTLHCAELEGGVLQLR